MSLPPYAGDGFHAPGAASPYPPQYVTVVDGNSGEMYYVPANYYPSTGPPPPPPPGPPTPAAWVVPGPAPHPGVGTVGPPTHQLAPQPYSLPPARP